MLCINIKRPAPSQYSMRKLLGQVGRLHLLCLSLLSCSAIFVISAQVGNVRPRTKHREEGRGNDRYQLQSVPSNPSPLSSYFRWDILRLRPLLGQSSHRRLRLINILVWNCFKKAGDLVTVISDPSRCQILSSEYLSEAHSNKVVESRIGIFYCLQK